MKKIVIIFIILTSAFLAFIAFGLFYQSQRSNTTLAGFQLGSQIWSGTIVVSGNIYFPPWATLYIKPGTRILFDKIKDDIASTPWTKWADAYIKDHNDPTGKEGYQKTHFLIAAKIIAIGTPDNRIIFTSKQEKMEYADWNQLVLMKGSHLEYIDLSYAHNGANIDGEDVIIRNSIIHDSLWSCIDSFSIGAIIENNEIYHCWHQGIGFKKSGKNYVRNNHIHDSQLAINCEFGANPIIENTLTEGAPIADDCPEGEANTVIERDRDTQGGRYDGVIIYPSK